MKPDIAAIAALFAEPARAKMISCLIDGRALPAGELAVAAGISAQTASNHLLKLLESGLLEVEIEGRYRYYRLANDEVASVVEALANLASFTPPKLRPNVPSDAAVQYFRHCYSHMAGAVGVRITANLLERKILVCTGQKTFGVTESGKAWFSALGIEVEALAPRGGIVGKRCLDWTERLHHLGGPLGVALMRNLLSKRWIVPAKESRALRITQAGVEPFERILGIRLPARRVL